MTYPTLKLIKGREDAVIRRHPWIFSGAVAGGLKEIAVGSPVWVADNSGKVLATGLFEGGSIAVKLLAFEKLILDKAFFLSRFTQAWELRKLLGLTDNKDTNAFRLVHSEGDQLPGLIVDIYGQTAVMQCHSPGIYRMREMLADALVASSNGSVKAVYDKSRELLPLDYDHHDGYLIGSHEEQELFEQGLKFEVDWIEGQKTGFFLDQRDARFHLRAMSAGRMVLNTFSYTGGFSVSALAGGAAEVVSVDSSRKAIAGCEKNVLLNGFAYRHEAVCTDAKKYLEAMPSGRFDIIVLDPPAFAKHHSQRHKGLLGYKFINQAAIKKIASGGLLYTFSCSQAVDRQVFQSIVMAAAIEAGRPVSILHHFSQPADHPVSIYHPEGAYLKGLLVRVL
ncbi:MAG: class I SAM-dependent rRNA methyltransferase [Bacteroidia bacterium]|nr:class I SAM-dependent rRNA methyltransferase [Bacteroidia bacterium]